MVVVVVVDEVESPAEGDDPAAGAVAMEAGAVVTAGEEAVRIAEAEAVPAMVVIEGRAGVEVADATDAAALSHAVVEDLDAAQEQEAARTETRIEATSRAAGAEADRRAPLDQAEQLVDGTIAGTTGAMTGVDMVMVAQDAASRTNPKTIAGATTEIQIAHRSAQMDASTVDSAADASLRSARSAARFADVHDVRMTVVSMIAEAGATPQEIAQH